VTLGVSVIVGVVVIVAVAVGVHVAGSVGLDPAGMVGNCDTSIGVGVAESAISVSRSARMDSTVAVRSSTASGSAVVSMTCGSRVGSVPQAVTSSSTPNKYVVRRLNTFPQSAFGAS